ncbi:protein kinase family protein [Domibacillus sp. 8LH]|uniref:protein kinase domain-containing protein n=1 Tax=Domibacillus sp. 8LH TaxID=3073900 RepID=UPI003177EB25
MKNRYEASPGEQIKGKWTGHVWRVEREIGRGANGIVYLVRGSAGRAALKFADSASVASETNALTALERVRGASPGPFFIEADDLEKEGAVYPFFLMEFIDGPMLHTFIKGKKEEWAIILLIWLLTFLESLHRLGHVMGDLKPENFIVVSQKAIRAVDVGGMTKFGRSIKEYTALYDRAAWQAGTRRAEPAYDLFGAAVLTVSLLHKQAVQRALGHIDDLKSIVQLSPALQLIEPVLFNAFAGKYESASAMKRDLLLCFAKTKTKTRTRTGRQKRKTFWAGKWFVLAGALAAILMLFLLH